MFDEFAGAGDECCALVDEFLESGEFFAAEGVDEVVGCGWGVGCVLEDGSETVAVVESDEVGEVLGVGESDAEPLGDVQEGAVVEGFGVGDDAVEVEDDGFDHVGSLGLGWGVDNRGLGCGVWGVWVKDLV